MTDQVTYDRRVNIYINGVEVENTIKSIKSEMSKANNELAKMTIGSQEYVDKASEIRLLKGVLKEHQEDLKATETGWAKIKSVADSGMGLITAGIAGIVGAYNAVKGVIFSTDALGDKFTFTLSGWKSGLDAVARSIATMDFKNFGRNIKDAIEEGIRYAEKQDQISDKLRALKFRESEVSSELLKQRAIENSVLKSKEERIAAGLKAEKLEDDLAITRTAISKKRYDAELENAMVITGQSPNVIEAYLRQDEGLMKLLKTGEQYLTLQNQIKNFEREQEDLNKLCVFTDNTKLIEASKQQLAALGPMAEEYSRMFLGLGKIIDQKKDQIVNAYASMKEAETSNLANTMKIRTKTATLMAEDLKARAEFQKKLDEQEKQNAAENTKHLNKWIEDQLDNMAKAEKRANDFQANLKKLLGVQEDSVSQERDKKWAADQEKRIKDIEKHDKKEEELNKAKVEKYQEFGTQIGQALGQAIADGTISAKEASKILLENALDALAKFAEIAIAKATVESMASPESVATFGIAGLAKAAILTGLIEAALAAAKGVISKNLWDGGYTGPGGKYQPAGIVHKGEWVANSSLVASAQTGPIIAALEQYQRTGMSGYADGGMVNVSSSGYRAAGSSPVITTTDPDLKNLIRQNSMLLAMLRRDGVNMKFGYIQADNVQKGLDKLSNIRGKVSM
jgi:hypothetical protein